jgi:hypothetical protein
MNIFEELGIFGLSQVEDLVLAGLVTGDPVLLVGLHGTAKTHLCSRIAKAMGLKFHAYDASKALFEDIIGFPNPYELKNGKIEYVSTSLSIWDKEFVLIDEISRANYQMQNKWLELIRSRNVMGLRVEKLKYIIGAMNPPGYPGAKTLDPALAGRFAFIIELPTFNSINPESRKKILKVISEDDAVMLNRKSECKSIRLSEMIEKAREGFSKIENEYDPALEQFIFILGEKLGSDGFYFDGRRAGMIRRSLVAVITVKKYIKEIDKISLEQTLRENVKFMLPYSVEEEDFNPEILDDIIDESVRLLKEGEKKTYSHVLNESAFTKDLKQFETGNDLSKRIKALFLLQKYNTSEDIKLRNKLYQVWTEIFSQKDNERLNLTEYIFHNGSGRNYSLVNSLSELKCLSLWIYGALNIEPKRRYRRGINNIDDIEVEEIEKILQKIIGG